MDGRFILNGHEPVACDDLMEWGRWMKNSNRQVARTTVGQADVSTVFLGLDHSFCEGEPILFETLIFGGPRDGDMWRFSTWDEAEAHHAKLVAELRGSLC